MFESPLRLATRGSALALWQANRIRDLLTALHPGLKIDLVVIKTRPDRLPEKPLRELGGDKGLFVKEVEEAILRGEADAAIHSLKDLPAECAPGLEVCAFPEREDTRDALLCRNAEGLEGLPEGALVATASLRRRGQLLRLRPDLRVTEVRGNVDTRLGKLRDGQFDAMILAAAGLARLGFSSQVTEFLSPGRMLPAAGQGALALEGPMDSPWTPILRSLDNGIVRACVEAERIFTTELGADCQSAAACLVSPGSTASNGDMLYTLEARVVTPDGRRVLDWSREEIPGTELPGAAVVAARELIDQGAGDMLHCPLP